jgi:transcriptional regulator with XRE-family HTH domain
MPKVPCYLRTRRKEWCLTQKEIAGLLGSYRARISKIELGLAVPSSFELLAYAFIFGCTPESLFPEYADDIQDAVMAGASRLSVRLEHDDSPEARRKSELLQNMLDRVTSYIPNT